MAPGLSTTEDVLAILGTRTNLRVVTASFAGLDEGRDARSILGAWLVQARDRVREASERWPGHGAVKVVSKREPTPAEWDALRFAWRVCAHVKSNTVIFTSDHQTLAVGAGTAVPLAVLISTSMPVADRLKSVSPTKPTLEAESLSAV